MGAWVTGGVCGYRVLGTPATLAGSLTGSPILGN